MNLKDLRRLPEERISALLGIPAIVAGLGAGLDRSTFSNMSEARQMAYESNIIPTQRIFATTLNRQLLSRDFISEGRRGDGMRPKNPDRIEVYFDNSGVRVLQEDEDAKTNRLNSSVKTGWMRVSEARRQAGLPTNEFDEVYLRTPNMVEVLADEPRPEPEDFGLDPDGGGMDGGDKPPEDDDEKEDERKQAEETQKGTFSSE